MSIQNHDEYLMLSGMQHYAFCKRQWALIHIEKQWEENSRTFGGQQMHKRADDPFFTESRGDILISRSMPLVSDTLRVYGIADVVEFHKDNCGIRLESRPGLWKPVPVEYKYGKAKPTDCDEVQLCAQAVCLEEMFDIKIPMGFIYYGMTRHRLEVDFSDLLRKRVSDISNEMWSCFEDGAAPKPELKKNCKSCSLYDLCMPELSKKKTVKTYIKKALEDVEI